MNNNKTDTAALEARCKGVFSPCGYLFVGSEVPFEDPNRNVRDSYKGKQFLGSVSKTGKTLDTYFGLDNSKKHCYIAEGMPYSDRELFAGEKAIMTTSTSDHSNLETQPKKPGKGFLTSDYSKRGEFTNTIRTEQYRTLLKREEKVERMRRIATHNIVPIPAPKKVQEGYLFDKVFDNNLPGFEAQKLLWDTRNPTMLQKERNYGTYNTTYTLSHKSPTHDELHRPEHARRAVVRDTFYDKDMKSQRV